MALTAKQARDLSAGGPEATTALGGLTGAAASAAATAIDATVIDATYGAPEEAVLNNVRTRLNELEAALQAHGIIA